MHPIRRIEMFGCPMDCATMNETVAHICSCIDRKQFVQHGAINVGKLVSMQDDAELHKAVSDCDLISVDGMGLVWGGRLLGLEIPQRVAGIDLFWRLVKRSEKAGYSIFLLGATKEVVEKTSKVLQQQFPNLKIAGYHHGYFWDNEEAVVEQVRNSGAQLLFVAVTSPRKEIFINQWQEQFGVSFAMGVGGTFDVVAGKVSRAPRWMQNIALEWLFRVIQEPRRMLTRYLVSNAKFAKMLIKALRSQA
jgi:N-acetylglucosaminyldiphosphoundecaprenol N-acetyl-beta-D-mannosaminyltransferase